MLLHKTKAESYWAIQGTSLGYQKDEAFGEAVSTLYSLFLSSQKLNKVANKKADAHIVCRYQLKPGKAPAILKMTCVWQVMIRKSAISTTDLNKAKEEDTLAKKIKAIKLKAENHAEAIHIGPKDIVSTTLDSLLSEIENNNLKPDSIFQETYLSQPGQTRPELLKVKVGVPVKK